MRGQILCEFLAPVVHGDTSTPKFADEFCLTEVRDLSRLPQCGFFGREETNGEVQSRACRRETALDRCWKRDLR